MSVFEYRNNELYCENVPLQEIAEHTGTPCYVYSKDALLTAFTNLDKAFKEVDHLTCFAIKSNANLSVLKLFAEQGAGMDIVSRGELFRALKAGVPPERIVYSGVGKTIQEIRYALENGIYSLNVESLPELFSINRIAGEMGKIAPVSLRINPDVESHTHEYTSTGKKENKFGIPYDHAVETYTAAASMKNLRVVGLAYHIGSQIISLDPFLQALRKLAGLFSELRTNGFELEFIDIGGGLGINYNNEAPPSAEEYARAVLSILAPLDCRIILEPGRFISGNSGILLTRVVFFKETASKNFAVVDAGMNDLIRPSFYNAYHKIQTVKENGSPAVKMDVVGPICESGDWLAKDRLLPKLEEGELLCVHSAGAYCFTMSSNYNARPRGTEVLVDKDSFRVVRKAETLEDLIRGEEI